MPRGEITIRVANGEEAKFEVIRNKQWFHS
jgi:hypothetical protein